MHADCSQSVKLGHRGLPVEMRLGSCCFVCLAFALNNQIWKNWSSIKLEILRVEEKVNCGGSEFIHKFE